MRIDVFRYPRRAALFKLAHYRGVCYKDARRERSKRPALHLIATLVKKVESDA
jgi:hypothetical protein